MSGLIAPCARRSVLSAAACRSSALSTMRPTGSQLMGTMRWFSGNTLQGSHFQSPCPRQRLVARIRTAMADPTHGCGSRRTFFSPAIIRNYEELPGDYRDQTGLSFRNKPLSEAEVNRIFGPELDVEAANQLLRILHGRRVAGTLEDPAFYVNTAGFPEDQIAKGLEYLRETVEVEEVMNAGLRAEDELAQIERQEEEKLRKKKAARKGAKEPVEETDDAAAPAKTDSVYGRSTFDEIRARNIAQRKAREKEREAQEAARVKDLPVPAEPAGPLAVVAGKERNLTNPAVAKYYEEATSSIEAPPEVTTTERVLASVTVTLLAIGFMAAVALVYQEPSDRYRLFPQISPASATVGTIIALNVLGFLAWRLPPLWALCNKYMILTIGIPKPLSLFTCIFSQQKLNHLVLNMVPLWFVGTSLHNEMTRGDFLALFLSCGSLGFLGSLITYSMRGWLGVTTLGASGAVLGLCSAYFWEHRTDGFSAFGLPEHGVHGIVFWALMVAMQLAMYGKTSTVKIDLVSHMVGMAAGVLGIELINRSGHNKDLEAQKRKDEMWRRMTAQRQKEEEEEQRRVINCTGWLTKHEDVGVVRSHDAVSPPGRRYDGPK